MKKALISLLLVSAFASLASASMGVTQAEKEFKKTYPNVRYTDFTPSPVDGLYEVAAGDNILYFYPEKGYLIFGEIYTSKGMSLTTRTREKTAGKVEDRFPFSDAVKIGNGKNIVVEVSDPDCPYCRQAAAWLSGRKDITRYVYFLPLNIHPNAEYKAKYILCSNNRAQTYDDVYSGRFDQELPPISTDCDAEALLRRHTELAAGAGVYGTPVFWVNGERIDGADIELMESLLSGNR